MPLFAKVRVCNAVNICAEAKLEREQFIRLSAVSRGNAARAATLVIGLESRVR